MNFLTPYVADDWSLASAESISDVFVRGYSHYFNTNGRVPAHILAMLFLLFPKWIFNIANTLVYLLFTGLILFHAVCGMELDRNRKGVLYLLIHLLLFVYVPNWGQVFLWLDGACNYLWTGTIMLLYLVPFRRVYDSGENVYGKRMVPGMFLMGILAGWCNENTSGGIILLLGMSIACFWFEKKRPFSWMYSGMAGTLLGFILMIISPGNAKRKTYFVDSRAWYNQLISRFQTLTNDYYDYYRYILYVLIVTIVILLALHVGRKSMAVIIGYLSVSVAVCYALVLSPLLSERAFLGSSVFLVISLISAMAMLLKNWGSSRILLGSYVGILTLTAAVGLVGGMIDIAYFKVHSDRRDRFVMECREEGMRNLVVNEISPKAVSKYNAASGLSDLKNNPGEWPSTSYASYYGVESVTCVSNDLFERVYKNGDKKLIDCRDIYEYLRLLCDSDYTVIMAVNDDSSGAVDEEIVRLMEKMGLDTDLREQFRWSYIAVIDHGKVVNEQYGNQVLNFYDGNLNGHSIEVESSGKIFNKGNKASIKIDGYEYARNSIGLNIVVFDTVSGNVVDRVTFNTWQGLEARR